jgi:hypothetical protein
MKTEIIIKNLMKNILKICVLLILLLATFPDSVLADESTSTEIIIDQPTEQVATSTEITNTEIVATSTEETSTTTEETFTITGTSTSTEEFFPVNETSTSTITINLKLRYQDTLVFSGPITLTKDAISTILDNTNTNREIITSTAFGALHEADLVSPNFNLSNLAYYASWNSFLINCLEVVTSTNSPTISACYNWQYVVNDTYPFVGSDQYNLSDGDNVYFYFGSSRIVELSTSTVAAGDSFIATAKSYDYQNNIYVPAPNYTIGITQPDPNNPWTPKVLFSTTSDVLGQGIFTIDQAGLYGVGIGEDYYSSLENLFVVDSISTATTTSVTTTTSATSTETTGSTSGSSETEASIDISKALEFLITNQSTNGSFSNDLYTDWAAIGLAASGNSGAKSLIKSYLISHNFSGDTLTDYERHTMALMSLGINPYTGTNKNYISKILSEFDEKQFGDDGLVNDDIFALFPLLNAGYNSSDLEILKTVEFIISKQSANGSWESVDLTAAAIQALFLVTNLPNVNSALEKAKNYLKNSEQGDGGFGNSFSTLWAMQAIKVLGEDQSTWIKNSKTPEQYIAAKQNLDGGLEFGSSLDTRVWATSYLLPAYYGKSWNDLMSNFKKPKIDTDSINSANNSDISSTETTEEVSHQNDPQEDLILPVTVNQPNLIMENAPLDENNGQDVDTKNNNKNNNQLEEPLNLSPEKSSQNNLQANVLEATLNLPILRNINSFVDTTLAGLGVMWGFIVKLFKI